MLVLHANWTDGGLHFWAESLERWSSHREEVRLHLAGPGSTEVARATMERTVSEVLSHPFTLGSFELRGVVADLLGAGGSSIGEAETMTIVLPCDAFGPQASERLASVTGDFDDEPWDHAAILQRVSVETVALRTDRALFALLQIAEHSEREGGDPGEIEFSQSVRYWIEVARFVAEMLEHQRFIPAVHHVPNDGLRALWQLWVHDAEASKGVELLLGAMPAAVRAVHDSGLHNGWTILNDAICQLTDAAVRMRLIADDFVGAIEGRGVQDDPHVAWLSGLLGRDTRVPLESMEQLQLLRQAGQWLGRLEDSGEDEPLRLCLTLSEPLCSGSDADVAEGGDDTLVWRVRFSLKTVSEDGSGQTFDAEDLWNPGSSNLPIGGERLRMAQERLLTELSRVARMFPPLEPVLRTATPSVVELDTGGAYRFLRDSRPILEEAGIEVRTPAWWSRADGRIGLRLHVDAPAFQAGMMPGSSVSGSGESLLGLESLVQFRWQVAVGEQPLSLEEFQSLARMTTPLARVRGQWVELDAAQIAAASKYLAQAGTGEMTLLQAIRMTSTARSEQIGLPVFGLDATGWVKDLLEASHEPQRMPTIAQPGGFRGELRPYQKTGLSWLSFLDRFGLGACLADDMGLGKTIQLIALLIHEREAALQGGVQIGPTLLIVPTSVIGNWERELQRFAPSLRAHKQHGPDRPLGESLKEVAASHDVVITTYALVARDQASLGEIAWRRVVLDEAQYIKNPPTKQAQAIRSLPTLRRLALTGTPVENRLTELWSIMEFCNPGYLGPAADFRRSFALPIERHRDKSQAQRLREVVRPFILRRLKTDRNVINDLPPCVETREYATLTPEQAALYEQTVGSMLGEVDRAEGLQRRGLVLATLVKLKQICNHPAQVMLSDRAEGGGTSLPQQSTHLSRRSGKSLRLLAMLEEVLSVGERALIFTQFRQMGHLLAAMIQHDLEVEPLFLHGGTPQTKRQEMIDRFQDPSSSSLVFVLSLKAGGLGLNLTAGNHVFHYDRWWNPAVENQATDRAFRIGQTRKVHVHKFVCMGTLEERIDQMIEQKTELAQNIIGSGEQWLTELSTQQLRDLLTLRAGAVEGDAE